MSLPSFMNPPVVEVAVSVTFIPLADWQIPHFGMYWQEIKGDFPKISSLPPRRVQIETQELWGTEQKIGIALADPNDVLCWYGTESEDRLLQIQRNSFSLNWKKEDTNSSYPRYEAAIRPEFMREFTKFREFVGRNKLGDINVIQSEITYVNDLPRGELWNAIEDLNDVLKMWPKAHNASFLPKIETGGQSLSFKMEKYQGRLHVSTKHVLRSRDEVEVVQLVLTARISMNNPELDEIKNSLDHCRLWIVEGFTELTSQIAHKHWGKK